MMAPENTEASWEASCFTCRIIGAKRGLEFGQPERATLQLDTAQCSEDRPQLTHRTESPRLLKSLSVLRLLFYCPMYLIFSFTVTKRKSLLMCTRCRVSRMNQYSIPRTHQMNHKGKQGVFPRKTVTKIVSCHLEKKMYKVKKPMGLLCEPRVCEWKIDRGFPGKPAVEPGGCLLEERDPLRKVLD